MRVAGVKVELKEKIQFLNALQQAGLRFDEATTQHDRVFMGDSKQTTLIARTSVDSGGNQAHSLIFRQYATNGTVLSYATEVADYEQLIRIIGGLGYKQLAEVNKQRQTVKITDTIMLSFDKVKELGEYIKLERTVGDKDNLNWIRADLAEALKNLGISENAKLAGPYGELLAKK